MIWWWKQVFRLVKNLMASRRRANHQLVIPEPSSPPPPGMPSPVSTFLLRPAWRACSRLALIDDSTSPPPRARRAVRHSILTDGVKQRAQFANADFQSVHQWKDIHQTLRGLFFFFPAAAANTLSPCHIICPILSAALGELITLYFCNSKRWLDLMKCPLPVPSEVLN